VAEFEFYRFVTQYNRDYSSVDEFLSRRDIFKRNYDYIVQHNTGGHSYTLAMNQFGDRLPEELPKTHFPTRLLSNYFEQWNQVSFDNVNAPSAVDWVKLGYVTPVENQLQCGSCWSFSASEEVSSLYKKTSGKLVTLSKQQLMDCSKPEGDMSCEGGLMTDAFDYVLKNHGLCTEEDYPYLATDEQICKNCTPVATINGYQNIPSNNETALMLALSQLPISIAIEADQSSFQFYSSGVYSDVNCYQGSLDHGVQLVAYGKDPQSGKLTWRIKNSWGTEWGDNGYITVERNVAGHPEGLCGLTLSATQVF
jgi:C1A family cysteine protease